MHVVVMHLVHKHLINVQGLIMKLTTTLTSSWEHKSGPSKYQGEYVEDKVVADLADWCLKPAVEAATCSIQNGFVANRQLLQSAVDFDLYSRHESLR